MNKTLKNTQDVPKGLNPRLAKYYLRNLSPLVNEFEKKRLSALSASSKGLIFSSLIFIPQALIVNIFIFYYMVPKDPNSLKLIIAVIALTGVLIHQFYSGPRKGYEKSVKEKVYPIIFRYFGDEYKYQRDGMIDKSLIRQAEIFPGQEYLNQYYPDQADQVVDDYLMSNYVSGKFRSTKVELTDLSTGNPKDINYFEGLIILLSVNKHFSSRTVLLRDRGLFNKFFRKTGKYRLVKLEGLVFEKQFEVYSTDQIEARCLLTPAFMERLLAIDKLLKSKVTCSFYGNHLLIAIPRKNNWFREPSLSQKSEFVHEFNLIYQQMIEIYKIIHILKLDKTTRV